MRLSLVLAGVLGVTSLASAGPAFGPIPKPGPPVRKPASLEYTAEELDHFAQAIIADKAGDLETASDHYRRAESDPPRPSTIYNHADVLRRMERYKDAIKRYREYLAAAPDAADKAEVEALVAKLEATPPIITVDGEDPRALVFLDGALVGPSPQTFQITPGWHVVDRIGPESYRHDTMNAKPLDTIHVQNTERRSKDEEGNVVLSASSGLQTSGSWKDGDRTWRLSHRNVLPPGRYETVPFGEKYLCNSVLFDVPPGGGVLYVYIDAGNTPDRSRCLPATVKTKKLVFPP